MVSCVVKLSGLISTGGQGRSGEHKELFLINGFYGEGVMTLLVTGTF